MYPKLVSSSLLMSKYIYLISCDADSSVSDDEYIDFFKREKMLSLDNDGTFQVGDRWANEGIIDDEKFINLFKQFVLEQSLFDCISNCMEGDRWTNRQNVLNACLSVASEDDVDTLLLWMEELRIISSNSKREYKLTEELTDDESYEDEGSIYPLSYKNKLNIEEEHFSVFDYMHRLEEDMIKMNPDFQRKLAWNSTQKSRFIESIILNIPIPPIYLKMESDNYFVIVDGQQRTAALRDFILGKFALTDLEALSDLNGKDFNQLKNLDKNITSRIQNKNLNFYVLQPSVSMSMVYDIFNRINTGGTKLERQEIRNCIFIGKSTQLLKEISESNEFRQSIDYGVKSERMKDREAILRCLSFVLFDFNSKYNGSYETHLCNTMKHINKLTAVDCERIKKKALSIFQQTYLMFGRNNFRIPTGCTRGRINIAVMESVFYCFWKGVKMQKCEAVKAFNTLVRDSEYIYSVKSSTNQKSKVRTRFTKAMETFGILTPTEND